MPLFAAAIVCFGLIKRVPVFDCFIQGAREGAGVLFQIAPTIIGLVFAVSLLRSSGAVDAICKFVQPAADFLGFPKEVVPMAMLRPVLRRQSSLGNRGFKRNHLLRRSHVLRQHRHKKCASHTRRCNSGGFNCICRKRDRCQELFVMIL